MIEIFNKENRSQWLETLKNNNINFNENIYHSPQYLELYEKDNSFAEAFFFKKANNFFYLPYIKNQISKKLLSEDYFDFETAYGYSGPLSNSEDKVFLNQAWENFNIFCSKARIIAGLIRFNPFLDNHLISKQKFIRISFEKDIVIKNLKKDSKDIYEQYEKDVKSNIKKAIKNNILINIDNSTAAIKSFRKVYIKLLKTKKTNDFYFFTENYFSKLSQNLSKNYIVILAKKNDEIVGAALVLISGQVAILHLSATDRKFSKFGTASLLRHEVVKYSYNNNIKQINFGGGLTSDKNDSLLKFKMGFSKETKKFYIGKFLSNKEIYEKVCGIWKKKYERDNKNYSKYFLKYNYI